MIWVSWRQHRSQAVACLGLLAALAVYAILLGSSMRTAFSHDDLAACLARSQGTSCPAAVSAFTGEFGSAVNIAFWAVLLIAPGLLGVLIGAPLIARENSNTAPGGWSGARRSRGPGGWPSSWPWSPAGSCCLARR